jgi:undecaprenyl-diphosphatase
MRLGGILILGVIQGLTEFLPVSSSGHLVIGSALLGLHEPSLLLDVLLHVGTLLPVLWLYRGEVLQMLAALGKLPALRRGLGLDQGLRLLVCVFVATIPTGLLGVLLNDLFEKLFSSPRAVGLALLGTGAILLATLLRRRVDEPADDEGSASLTPLKAVAVGFAQALAITPGISRSGTTIAASLLLGVHRETAARFSFLLSIPAILGATALHLRKATFEPALPAFAAGALIAAVCGYLALRLIVRFVRQGRLHWFAVYVIPLGLGVVAYTPTR